VSAVVQEWLVRPANQYITDSMPVADA